MKVYFSHGKESGPWGFKIKRLAEIAKRHGCDIDSIDYTDTMDADIRVKRLLDILENERNEYVLVGSSMGGYVSLVASEVVNAEALFLMAPALYIPGYKRQEYQSKSAHIEVVHGWSDDVIPPKHSIKFASAADCTLHLISGDHPLNGSIETVEALFEQFLSKVLSNWQ